MSDAGPSLAFSARPWAQLTSSAQNFKIDFGNQLHEISKFKLKMTLPKIQDETKLLRLGPATRICRPVQDIPRRRKRIKSSVRHRKVYT